MKVRTLLNVYCVPGRELDILLYHVCMCQLSMYHLSAPSPYFISFSEMLGLEICNLSFPEPTHRALWEYLLDQRSLPSLNHRH